MARRVAASEVGRPSVRRDDGPRAGRIFHPQGEGRGTVYDVRSLRNGASMKR